MPERKKIIFVSVHPDDETLGAGGTIIKRAREGCENYWLILTSIIESEGWSQTKIQERTSEIKKVSSLYGFKKTFQLGFPTTKLDTIPSGILVEKISKTLKEISPHYIYIPHPFDVHSDHRVAFASLISATKNFRLPSLKKILTYECLSETEYSNLFAGGSTSFSPNVFEDITRYLPKKLKIFKTYNSEVMMAPYPRSIKTIESLARLRGSRIGVTYAEAFTLLFEKV